VNLQRVERPDDPRVADYRDVRDPRRRGSREVFVAESRLLVRRLLARESRFRTRSVLVTPSALRALHPDLEARAAGAPVYLASQGVLNAIVGFDLHRGCAAAGERAAEPSLPEILAACAEGPRLLLALEGLADPGNVGGVFRNALAFGADAVLLAPGCADPLYRKAIRVSMGASLRVPFASLPPWPETRRLLRAAGFALVALAPRAAAFELTELGRGRPAPERLALLLGAEGEGLTAQALAQADAAVRIAMAPGCDSLNVATAAGIALHHLARLAPPAPARRGPRGPTCARS
jgi:tRNA G18 (ribose-2'-O)-methylase SpoU